MNFLAKFRRKFGRNLPLPLPLYGVAAVIATSHEAIIVVDGESGRIAQANAGAYELFGIPLVGAPLNRLIPPEHMAQHDLARAAYMRVPVARLMGKGLRVEGVTAEGRRLLDVRLQPLPLTNYVLAVIEPAK